MGVLECVAEVGGHVVGALDAEGLAGGALLLEHLVERAAVHGLGDQEDAIALHEDAVGGGHVLVLHHGSHGHLLLEADTHLRVAHEVAVEQRQQDRLAVGGVARAKLIAEGAVAEQLLDGEATRDDSAGEQSGDWRAARRPDAG